MNFVVERVAFTTILNTMLTTVARKSPLPAMSGILFTASETDGLTLITTNAERYIHLKLNIPVNAAFTMVVPAKLLNDWCHVVRDTHIKFEAVDETTLRLICGKVRTTIKCYPSCDFPQITIHDKHNDSTAVELNVDAKKLLQILQLTATGAEAIDTGMAFGKGINLFFDNNNIQIIATDSYRLANYNLPVILPANYQCAVTIPITSLNTITTVINMAQADSEATLVINENNIVLLVNGKNNIQIVLGIQLLDINYPTSFRKYKFNGTTVAYVERIKLLNALNIAVLFAKENVGRLQLNFTETGLVIMAQGIQSGEHEDTLECTVVNTGYIMANIDYILDWLRSAVNVTTVEVSMINHQKPLCFRDKNNIDSGYYLVMPMQETTNK